MVDIAYALTLSASSIPYSRNERDQNVFEAMVESMVRFYRFIGYLNKL